MEDTRVGMYTVDCLCYIYVFRHSWLFVAAMG